MSQIKLLKLEILGDNRGSLIALEQNKNIPFDIKRVYYIFNTKPNVSRGFHAHYKLEQVAICLKGSVTFIVDNGLVRERITLSSPDKGLYIKGIIWREMHDFSEDCVLLVLANDIYYEADYIRNYDEFLLRVQQ